MWGLQYKRIWCYNYNNHDQPITVPFLHFEKVEFTTKKSLKTKSPRVVKTDASITFITDFISNLLPKLNSSSMMFL